MKLHGLRASVLGFRAVTSLFLCGLRRFARLWQIYSGIVVVPSFRKPRERVGHCEDNYAAAGMLRSAAQPDAS